MLADGVTRSMCCQLLVDSKADPHAVGDLGDTPLHIAARWGDPNVCKQLVESGASVNAATHNKTTPLHLAVEVMEAMHDDDIRKSEDTNFSGYECCLQLLQLKAKPDAATAQGWSPLLLAARRGNSELCDLLLKLASMNTIAISQATCHGWGALHMAAISGSATTCETLSRLGADPRKVAQVYEVESDSAASSMTPCQLAEYLHEHNDLYNMYTASWSSSFRPVTRFDSPSSPTRPDTQRTSSFGIESPLTQFEGVVKVLKGDVNPEDSTAVHSQKVVNTVKKFHACGF